MVVSVVSLLWFVCFHLPLGVASCFGFLINNFLTIVLFFFLKRHRSEIKIHKTHTRFLFIVIFFGASLRCFSLLLFCLTLFCRTFTIFHFFSHIGSIFFFAKGSCSLVQNGILAGLQCLFSFSFLIFFSSLSHSFLHVFYFSSKMLLNTYTSPSLTLCCYCLKLMLTPRS